MKNVLIILSIFTIISCGNHENFTKNTIKHNRELLKVAFETGDHYTAIMASQSILMYDTANTGLMDTLMNLYSKVNDLGSTFVMSKKILAKIPDNFNALSKKAICANKLSRPADAIDAYAKLYDQDKNTRFLYEIAVQYYSSNNVSQGEQIISTILSDPKSRTDTYPYLTDKGSEIKVPVIAVTYLFVAEYKKAIGEYKEAEEYYNYAIDAYEGYDLAKAKLIELKKLK